MASERYTQAAYKAVELVRAEGLTVTQQQEQTIHAVASSGLVKGRGASFTSKMVKSILAMIAEETQAKIDAKLMPSLYDYASTETPKVAPVSQPAGNKLGDGSSAQPTPAKSGSKK